MALVLAWWTAGPAPVEAQVSGRVLDAATREGIPFANVALLDSLGNVWAQVATDSTGYFSVIPMTNDAVFEVQVIAMGYASAPVEPIRYNGDPVHRVIGIVAQPMEIDGLTVEVEGQDLRLLLFGYYDRKERGYGHFIDEEQIRASPVPGVTGALRGAPGMLIRANRLVLQRKNAEPRAQRGMGSARGLNPGPAPDWMDDFCIPAVFVNGAPDFRLNETFFNDFSDLTTGRGFNDLLPAKDDLIGIEVYRSAASLPRDMQIALEQVTRRPISFGCGAILLWTRMDDLQAPRDTVVTRADSASGRRR